MNTVSNIKIKYAALVVVSYMIVSCSKMDASYKDFLEGGEKVYAGKVDSVKAIGGRNRIRLSGLLSTDPNVNKCRVYWNNRTDSMEAAIDRTDRSDSLNITINNLEEGAYTFEMVTSNSFGNSSVKTEVIGKVYGSIYQSTLVNRLIKSTSYVGGVLTIEWYPADETMVQVVLNYTDASGTLHSVPVSQQDELTILENFKNGSSFTYNTVFLPEPMALDSFYTEPVSRVIVPVEAELDPALFTPYILPGDAQPQNAAHSLSRLWNGNIGAGGDYRTNNNSTMPQHYNWSLGVTAKLTKIRVYQRGANAEPNLLYLVGNPKYFEIWGSNDPAPDGSEDGWTRLLECESIKPSGPGEVTEADRDYARPGEVYVFPADSPPVKYVRIKFLQTWGNTLYSMLNEVDVYGIIQ